MRELLEVVFIQCRAFAYSMSHCVVCVCVCVCVVCVPEVREGVCVSLSEIEIECVRV